MFFNTDREKVHSASPLHATRSLAAGRPGPRDRPDLVHLTVYVSAGAERNVLAGVVLNGYRKGKVFTDPATGVVLEVASMKIGVIRIEGVRDKLSTAAVVSGETPVRGDLLELN